MKNIEEEAFYKVLGSKIRALRGSRISQEQLANLVGLTRTSIVNIEAGQQKLLVHNLFRIASALAMKPSEIISPIESDHQQTSFETPKVFSPDIDAWASKWNCHGSERQLMIRKKLIANATETLLSECGIYCAPVQVEQIALLKGAKVVEQPLDDQEVSGFLFVSPGSPPVIGVNSMHTPKRKRFTIAHELGHLILHSKKGVHLDSAVIQMRNGRSSEGVDEEEVEANRFAAELLMPRSFLLSDLQKMEKRHADDEVAIEELAKKYEVSVQAMTIRLGSLGLVEL